MTLCGSIQRGALPSTKEKSMESTESNKPIADDVLHLGSQSKLSPEEIAKALAHHNRHHGGGEAPKAEAGGKKQKKSK